MGSVKQEIQPGGSSGNSQEDGKGGSQEDSLESNQSRLKGIRSFQERLLQKDEINGVLNVSNSIEKIFAQLGKNLEMTQS